MFYKSQKEGRVQGSLPHQDIQHGIIKNKTKLYVCTFQIFGVERFNLHVSIGTLVLPTFFRSLSSNITRKTLLSVIEEFWGPFTWCHPSFSPVSQHSWSKPNCTQRNIRTLIRERTNHWQQARTKQNE